MNGKTALGTLIAALAAATIAGCGTAAPAGPSPAAGAPAQAPTAAQHNDVDVAFANGMIPHHTQAVGMSQLATGRAASPKVVELAARIAAAQGPEITQLQGYLRGWNVAAAPTGSVGAMAGMDHGGGTSGMMSDAQMQQLSTAGGAEFDRMFLRMMIEHHTGAIAMAQTEVRDGQSPDTKALAQKIIDAQQSEIATMRELLTAV